MIFQVIVFSMSYRSLYGCLSQYFLALMFCYLFVSANKKTFSNQYLESPNYANTFYNKNKFLFIQLVYPSLKIKPKLLVIYLIVLTVCKRTIYCFLFQKKHYSSNRAVTPMPAPPTQQGRMPSWREAHDTVNPFFLPDNCLTFQVPNTTFSSDPMIIFAAI